MPPPALTADDLLHLYIPNKQTELVRGRLLVREPPGGQHGALAFRLAMLLGRHIEENDLGVGFAAETGFKLFSNPDTVRAPDFAFVAKHRVPSPIPRGYVEAVPDLAVEVLSPHDRPGEVLTKIGDWLEAGVALAWVIDPSRRTARVYRRDGTETTVTDTELLTGEDVVPGFSCVLGDVL